MAYLEIRPVSAALIPLIECFWLHQSSPNQSARQRVMPDGCVDIIYCVSNAKALANERSGQFIGSPVIVGTMTEPITTQLYPAHDYVGIRFRPGGIAAFIPTPLSALTNRIVSVEKWLPRFNAPIQEPLEASNDWSQRIQWLEMSLLDQLRQAVPLCLPMLAVVDHILTEKGLASLNQLSEVASLSPRQLERLFLRYVGVSPKLLTRIIRFRHVKAILDSKPNDSLMGIAFETGYTDHAHLTKEFIAFAGVTPSLYRGK